MQQSILYVGLDVDDTQYHGSAWISGSISGGKHRRLRYAGCFAPHSKLRPQVIPTPRQQGVGSDESKTGTPYWNWARLLGRVFNLDMATCPFCRRGSLRISAAITHEEVITRILRHLKLASVPPPIAPAPARLCREIFVFDDAHAGVVT